MKKSFFPVLVLLAAILVGATMFSRYPGSTDESGGRKDRLADVYDLYYVTSIQKKLGEVNKSLLSDMEENLKDRDLSELTKGEPLTPLPNLWFYSQLTKQEEPNDLFKKEIASYLSELQQKDGLFIVEPDETNTDSEDVAPRLLPTKMAIDLFKNYDEKLPNSSTLLDTVSKEFEERLGYEQDMQINGHVLLILQILQELDPTSEQLNKAKDAIPFERLQKEIEASSSDVVAISDMLDISKILYPDKNFDPQVVNKVEKGLSGLQLKNGSFPFPNSKEPDILSTYLSVKIMDAFGIEIKDKEKIQKYSNEIGISSVQN